MKDRMNTTITATLLLLAQSNLHISAFTTTQPIQLPLPNDCIFPSTTRLNSHAIDNDDNAMYIMMKANVCAHSDTCSVDEAEEYLKEVLHLQSDCVTGSLTNEKICDDVIFPSEVISALREKIANDVDVRNQGRPFKLGLNPVFLTVAGLYISSGILSASHNPDTFTSQEWIYAARDGYLGDMISQYMKYGGLSPLTLDESGNVASTITPFTSQEMFWSIRDGYFGDVVSAIQKNGGLKVDLTTDSDLIPTTPFTTEEFSYAAKDGYLSDLIEHYMKNGGL